jgi:hypothetical protein
MNHPADNPYAAPQTELGETVVSSESSKSIKPMLWCVLVVLNAICGMYLATERRYDTLAQWTAILIGIAVVGTIYAVLEYQLRRRGQKFWATAFFFGAILRIPFQLVVIFDAMAGMVASSLVLDFYNIIGYNGHPFEPLTAFLLTVFTGLQLAIMAVGLGIIPAAINKWGRR